jgi:hypothetical protein
MENKEKWGGGSVQVMSNQKLDIYVLSTVPWKIVSGKYLGQFFPKGVLLSDL